MNQLVADTDAWVRENVPEAMVRVRKYAVGAFDDWKIEARFSGPANADPATLRRLAEEGVTDPARLPVRQGSPHQLARASSRPWFPATTRSAAAGPACRATIWPARRSAHPTASSSVSIGRRTT